MKDLAYSNRNNEYVYRARLSYGWRPLETPDEAEGIRVLRSIPKSANDWRELADFYLRELEEKRQTSGQAGK